MNREQAKEHLQSVIRDWECSPRLSYEMAAVLKESGEAIGRAHILIDEETGDGMIGWFLLKAYWGRHYASEMTAGLIDYSFNTLHISRVYAVCNPENAASRKVLENSGMRLVSVTEKKCRYLKDGIESWHDEAEYELLNGPPAVAATCDTAPRG